MGDDAPLKSAYELAMERLQADDDASGVERRPLTARQKAAIAEARAEAKAKRAELEILHGKHLAAAGGDPTAISELETNHAIDRERVDTALESKLARIRRGES